MIEYYQQSLDMQQEIAAIALGKPISGDIWAMLTAVWGDARGRSNTARRV
ncbi:MULTISPECIES: hypothetical protein [unclassified Microcoleus]